MSKVHESSEDELFEDDGTALEFEIEAEEENQAYELHFNRFIRLSANRGSK